jgi:hypothetical protein
VTEDVDITEHDLAEQVIAMLPEGTTAQHGATLLDLIEQHATPSLLGWSHSRHVTSLGTYVKGVKADQEKRRQAERDITYGVSSATGLPISPTLSVKTDAGPQLMLWFRASPQQFVEAVLREQQVVDGRHNSNSVRMRVVQLLLDNEELMALATLEDVCRSLGLDPQALNLNELDVAS